MFIHWGLYTVGGLDCWMIHDMGIPTEEYIARYEPEFTGRNFDAMSLMALAKRAGCKYVVMGTRHHEGYCLWNTNTTAFSSAKMTPKRDFIAEYVNAARKIGLKVGLYYSLLDWRAQAYWKGPRKDPKGWSELIDYVHEQVRELMTRYGKIDILWYDGAWPPHAGNWGFSPGTEKEINFGLRCVPLAKLWRAPQLNAMVRRLQPGILINNRTYLPGDFGTPEQEISPESRPWELCDPLGDFWGASSADLNHKTSRQLITRLILCGAQDGNMLLNIGPRVDGTVLPWQRHIMEQIGDWLGVHGEAIYGCTGEWQRPFSSWLAPWRCTRKKDVIYMHLLRYPGTTFSIANLHNYHLVSASILDTGDRLKIDHQPTRDIISGLPQHARDKIATVVKIKIRQKTASQKRAARTVELVGLSLDGQVL